MLKVMLTAALLVTATNADAAAEQGEYAGALRRMISESAAGRCPDDVMATRLLAACREQLPTMGPALAKLGAITDMSFIKAETGANGRVETYSVAFAGGEKAIWSIGGQTDGKFAVAYTLSQ